VVQVPVAHGVPSGAVPMSVQTGAPLVQTNTAVWHGSAEVQGSPAVQALHVPAPSQTWFAPQLVPGAWKPMGVSWVQTGTPVVQEFVPKVHGFAAG